MIFLDTEQNLSWLFHKGFELDRSGVFWTVTSDPKRGLSRDLDASDLANWEVGFVWDKVTSCRPNTLTFSLLYELSADERILLLVALVGSQGCQTTISCISFSDAALGRVQTLGERLHLDWDRGECLFS